MYCITSACEFNLAKWLVQISTRVELTEQVNLSNQGPDLTPVGSWLVYTGLGEHNLKY